MKISIPQPCPENWNRMTPSENGRHCGSCNKVVVDFTKMSEEEIKKYFLGKTERVCGHFYEHQVQQPENRIARQIIKWYCWAQQEISYAIPRMAAVFVLGVVLSLMGCNSSAEVPLEKFA